jgi:UDP-N-acetylmuramoyl-tripeptide--D-alanyl-D-alanine ligase
MVLEMGASAKGNIATLCSIARPSVGIITSIGPAHVETFGSVEKIASAKWELIDALPPEGWAVLPAEQPELAALIQKHRGQRLLFGEGAACDVRASQIEMGERVRFVLHIRKEESPVQLPVSGRFNVRNALAAAAGAWAVGTPMENIVRGLERFDPPPMRMQVLRHPSGAIFINDAYNANPASMVQAARAVVETYPHKQTILVSGSMLELGTESSRLHHEVGAQLGKINIKRIYFYGPESAPALEGARSTAVDPSAVDRVTDFQMLRDMIRPWLGPETVVLFKGSRSMKLEQAIQLFINGES